MATPNPKLLKIDGERVGSHYPYSCASDTRNGHCPNRVWDRYHVGEDLHIGFCKRHSRMYQEIQKELLARVEHDHQQGLHGEGEDRRAFAQPHVMQEWWSVLCQACADELKAEDLGVNPDQADEAADIQRRKERDAGNMVSLQESFTNMVAAHDLTYAVLYYADKFKTQSYRAQLWARVDTYMSEGAGWRGLGKMNLVDAYNAVAEEQKTKLITDSFSDAYERNAAADFIRGW